MPSRSEGLLAPALLMEPGNLPSAPWSRGDVHDSLIASYSTLLHGLVLAYLQQEEGFNPYGTASMSRQSSAPMILPPGSMV